MEGSLEAVCESSNSSTDAWKEKVKNFTRGYVAATIVSAATMLASDFVDAQKYSHLDQRVIEADESSVFLADLVNSRYCPSEEID